MPRLRSKSTGVVVSVSEETAARLASEYEPIEEARPAKKTAAAKRTAKPTDSEPDSNGEE